MERKVSRSHIGINVPCHTMPCHAMPSFNVLHGSLLSSARVTIVLHDHFTLTYYCSCHTSSHITALLSYVRSCGYISGQLHAHLLAALYISLLLIRPHPPTLCDSYLSSSFNYSTPVSSQLLSSTHLSSSLLPTTSLPSSLLSSSPLFSSVNVRGHASSLHVIIFDEFDSIGRTRGSSRDASGVRDSCVNQLLTLLDGTRQMSNVLVMALTNRKDMVDPALLRPGRLEVHIEIGLPTQEGRKEILEILFAPLLSGNYVSQSDKDIWIERIARVSKGASGADLSGLMRNAASQAIERWQAEHRYREGMRSLTVERSTGGLLRQEEGQGQGQGTTALYIDESDPTNNMYLSYIWGDFEVALLSLNS